MRFVKISADSYPKWIEFSPLDQLYPLLRKALCSVKSEFSENFGEATVYIKDEYLSKLVDVLDETINQLLVKHVPSDEHTHIVKINVKTVKLNVRRDADRAIAHLALVLDITQHCNESRGQLKIEVRDD